MNTWTTSSPANQNNQESQSEMRVMHQNQQVSSSVRSDSSKKISQDINLTESKKSPTAL